MSVLVITDIDSSAIAPAAGTSTSGTLISAELLGKTVSAVLFAIVVK